MKKEGLIFNTYTNMFWLLMIMPLPIMLILNCISPSLYMIEGVFSITRVYEVYIDLITPVGTIVLGITATLQNKQLQKLEERADARENGCEVFIRNSEKIISETINNEYAISYVESKKYMQIVIKNYSDAFLKAVKISFGNDDFYSTLTLAKGSEKDIRIKLPLNGIKDDDIEHRLFLCIFHIYQR